MARSRVKDGLPHHKHKVLAESLDGYELGVHYAQWLPGSSFNLVLSVASTLKYGYTDIEKNIDPVQEAIAFLRGYMSVCGIFQDEPEYSQQINDCSMKYSTFLLLLERSRQYKNKDHASHILCDAMNENSLDRRKNNTMTTTKDILAEKRAAALNKQASTGKSDPASYEENTSGYVNTVTLSGSLARDTDYVFDQNNDSPKWEMAKNGLAVFNRDVKGKEDKKRTKWVDLSMFRNDGTGKGSDNSQQFVDFLGMEKGAKVVVTGWIGWRYWSDRLGVEHETTVLHIIDIK